MTIAPAARIDLTPPGGSGFGSYQVQTPIGAFTARAARDYSTMPSTLGSPRWSLQMLASGLQPPRNTYRLGGKANFFVTDKLTRFASSDWRMTGSRGMFSTGRLASSATLAWLEPHLMAAVRAVIAAVGPMDIELMDATDAVEGLRPALERAQTKFLAVQADYMAALDTLAKVRLERGLT